MNTSLPAAFAARARALLGSADYRALEAALTTEEPPVSLRLNPWKWPGGAPKEAIPVPWAEGGWWLKHRPAFTFDPLLHAGCYYVQEASSMFLAQALRTHVHGPARVLDLCAAPGGKSTHARAILPEGSLLVANEVVRPRAQVLAENLAKWGHPATVITHDEAAAFGRLEGLFDVVLADVPCSGEGMFRKDPGAVAEWNEANVAVCRDRQRRILTDAWPCLRPGGLLVYSTCTFNHEENEDNIAWAASTLGAEVLPVPVEPGWGIEGALGGTTFPAYRFLPHRTRGEGFFLAVLRKEGNTDGTPLSGERHSGKRRGAKAASRATAVPHEAEEWLNRPDDFRLESDGTRVTAIPQEHAAVIGLLRRSVNVLQAGITLGETRGRGGLQPSQSLAMSTALRREAFPEAALTYAQALAYLRAEALALGTDLPRGYILLTYSDVPLGFAKQVGARANNLYPQEWRIRSTHLPAEAQSFYD